MDNHYDREAASKTLTAFIEHKQAKFPTDNGSESLTKLGSVQLLGKLELVPAQHSSGAFKLGKFIDEETIEYTTFKIHGIIGSHDLNPIQKSPPISKFRYLMRRVELTGVGSDVFDDQLMRISDVHTYISRLKEPSQINRLYTSEFQGELAVTFAKKCLTPARYAERSISLDSLDYKGYLAQRIGDEYVYTKDNVITFTSSCNATVVPALPTEMQSGDIVEVAFHVLIFPSKNSNGESTQSRYNMRLELQGICLHEKNYRAEAQLRCVEQGMKPSVTLQSSKRYWMREEEDEEPRKKLANDEQRLSGDLQHMNIHTRSRGSSLGIQDRNLLAFDTPSGLPLPSINLGKKVGIPDLNIPYLVSTAEVSMLQLEFRYLSFLDVYWETVDRDTVFQDTSDQLFSLKTQPVQLQLQALAESLVYSLTLFETRHLARRRSPTISKARPSADTITQFSFETMEHLIRSVVHVLSIAMILAFSSNIKVVVTNVNAVKAHKGETNATMGATNRDYVVAVEESASWDILYPHLIQMLLASGSAVALGIFQCLIGAQILSHHVDDFTLVSAFFPFSLGCLNVFTGLIYRERRFQEDQRVHIVA
ncbi:hypothetical protein BDP27DRAFT_1420395 [Rhodocollybia butyracea]|uniref:Uncharacterized protein n=1 Tax=Rhodocollybia butyracea TaxID=206335 RepID=A0A9P5PV95_9AGAR|nr:hypothetical protein BDP27DRAFT_1420395 [Rhodocollybia butyracea]